MMNTNNKLYWFGMIMTIVGTGMIVIRYAMAIQSGTLYIGIGIINSPDTTLWVIMFLVGALIATFACGINGGSKSK